jgi:hypothetical protein
MRAPTQRKYRSLRRLFAAFGETNSSKLRSPDVISPPLRTLRRALGALLFSAALCPPAVASFMGDYALNQFTLTDFDSVGGLSGTMGTAVTPDLGLSIVFTGSHSGSGIGGYTDLTINALADGLVQFTYDYSSLDLPGADLAGYLLGVDFFQLADTSGTCDGSPCPGAVSFPVSQGEIFGFRVQTLDNQGEPGILTISDFSAPGSDPVVPEPTALPVLLFLGAALVAARSMVQR